MLKGEKGITMIALVITVILLCLLASITISFSIGEEGVFTKSRRINYLDDISELQKELSEKEVLARANGQDNNTIKKELEEYLNNWLNSNNILSISIFSLFINSCISLFISNTDNGSIKTVEPAFETSCIKPLTKERYSSFTGITKRSLRIVIIGS